MFRGEKVLMGDVHVNPLVIYLAILASQAFRVSLVIQGKKGSRVLLVMSDPLEIWVGEV